MCVETFYKKFKKNYKNIENIDSIDEKNIFLEKNKKIRDNYTVKMIS